MVTRLDLAASRPALACIGAAALVGCAGGPVETAQPPRTESASSVAIPANARAFDIDPVTTRITVLVYRTGPLARLGHNHAITSGTESGAIWLGASPAASGFEIHVPVSSFVVDDPDARAAAGGDFPGTVPDEARAGTTANMLRAEVLDAQRYPEVVVRAEGATGTWRQAVVHASIRLKDLEREMDVPVALTVDANSVTATGSFQVRQTDFGITPFSVGGGAIQVADVVQVTFEVRGVRQAAL